MGDALSVQERDLLDLGDPGPFPHRLLKAGHHGSRSASDPQWVAALRPEVAIIPAGYRNRFEHPHPETLETFQHHGLVPWVTGPACGVEAAAVPGGWRLRTGEGQEVFTPLRTSPQL